MMTWQAMQRRSKSDVLHFSWSNSCWLYTRIDRTWIRLYLSIFDRDCRPVDTIETFHSQTAHNTAFEVVENIHKTASPMCQFKTTLHTSYCFQCNIGDRPLFSIFSSALYFRLHLQPVNYPAAHISFSMSFPGLLWSSSSSVASIGVLAWQCCHHTFLESVCPNQVHFFRRIWFNAGSCSVSPATPCYWWVMTSYQSVGDLLFSVFSCTTQLKM